MKLIRTLAIAVAAMATISSSGMSAQAMSLVEQTPMVNQIMQGSGIAFSLRFDQPVDHRHSSLGLISAQGTKALHARFTAEPNTLFSTIGQLPPGDYTLHWRVRAEDGQMLMGAIPFRLAP